MNWRFRIFCLNFDVLFHESVILSGLCVKAVSYELKIWDFCSKIVVLFQESLILSRFILECHSLGFMIMLKIKVCHLEEESIILSINLGMLFSQDCVLRFRSGKYQSFFLWVILLLGVSFSLISAFCCEMCWLNSFQWRLHRLK